MSDVFGIGQGVAASEKLAAAGGAAGIAGGAAGNYSNINPAIAANPQLQGQQQQLLQTALGRIQNGGLNAADLGRLNAIRNSTAQSTHAGQAAAQSQAQQMGATQGNSGILGAMVAGQQAANQGSNEGMQANQQALGESNAMLGQGSSMANNLQNQGLGIQQQNFSNQMGLSNARANAAYNTANALNSVGTNASNATMLGAGAFEPKPTGGNNVNSPNWGYYNDPGG